MPTPAPTPVREWRDVTPDVFRNEILPAQKPALLRGAVRDWPAVRAGLVSPLAMANYLRAFDTGASAETMYADPAIDGQFFYNDELTGHNFERRPERIAASLEHLLSLLDAPSPPAVYVGAVPLPSSMPGFVRENVLPLIDANVAPRLWLGNRVTVQTHYDLSQNVACVVAGRRRFTLFPPEQLVNLYVGPLEFTLAGQPISMVRLHAPDLEKYPRFTQALEHAQFAELEPGDAVFVPYMWWHHVESRERFNVLVNYWWDETPAWQGSPFEALLHGLLSVRSLPPQKRDIWRVVFEHYVFQGGGDPVAHLAQRQRGIQGTASPQIADVLRAKLLQDLSRRRG
jgi:cupin-like protein